MKLSHFFGAVAGAAAWTTLGLNIGFAETYIAGVALGAAYSGFSYLQEQRMHKEADNKMVYGLMAAVSLAGPLGYGLYGALIAKSTLDAVKRGFGSRAA